MSFIKLKPVAFALLVSTTLLSCRSGQKAEEKETEILPEDIVELRDDQRKMANIEMGSVEIRTISNNLKVNGTVNVAPQNRATVCMPMGGFVKSIRLAPGSAVRKGEVLAILTNQEFVDIQQNYLEAKNRFDYAEAEYKRYRELFKEDISSQKNMQQVISDYKSLKTQVKALEQKLSLIGIQATRLTEDNISSAVSVVSPISGYMKSVNISMGKYVSSSDILFEIVNTDALYLDLTLFEKDADKVSIGQKIHFFINNETDQHDAVIYQTAKSINSDKTYNVYAKVVGVCKNTLPGMYVNAIIETSNDKVMALPSEAVVRFDDKEYIFILEREKVEDGKPFTEYRMVEISKGVTENGYTQITLPDTLKMETIKVVIKGAYKLLSAKKNAGEMSCG
ncbi:MAG: efflux RND transporter periplasmic adaptor subunit [Bacteroidales bacterium]|nr:efflux RND transporter periplasmic adaptor subunit [Bacteroidales bacterium]